MINQSLEFISDELALGLGITSDVSVENLSKIKDENLSGLIISLLNVQEESTLKNSPHVIRKANRLAYKEPPVYLNLYTLMAFEFEDYGTSLQRLEETVLYFQNKSWFSSENERADNPFPSGLKKLILDLQNLTFEQLNHIWSISGGSHCLSLLYRIRLVIIEPLDEIDAPEIDTIKLESGLLK